MNHRFGILEIIKVTLSRPEEKICLLQCYIGLVLFSLLYQIVVYQIGIKIPEFYDILQRKDFSEFLSLILVLFLLILVVSACKSAMDWTGGLFSLTFRRSLTYFLHSKHLTHLYSLKEGLGDLDNPDQRITQDVDKLSFSIGFILEKVVISPLLMIYYWIILVQIDGWTAPLSLFSFFIVSCIVSHLVIGPMSRVIFKKEQKEGDLRYVHVRLLESIESVAFLNGQHVEKTVLDSKLNDLLVYQNYLIYWQMLLSFLTGTLDYLGTLISYGVVAVPIFLGSVEPDA